MNNKTIRIYKRNNNILTDINKEKYNDIINNKQIKIQRYLNLIKKTVENVIEVYTEQTELLYENDDYIVVEYKKILQDNELFPNLKVYEYDKNIEYNETNIKIEKINNINNIKKIKLIKELITFLEIELNDNFKESYLIKTLLDQIKQQILNRK